MKALNFGKVVAIPPARRSYMLSNDWVLPNCNIGVELELENAGGLVNTIPEDSYWSVTNDDSLRNNGYEFIFSEPYGGLDLSKALDEMEGHLLNLHATGKKYFPVASFRTSSHVHLDVRDCTIQQYKNIVLLSIMFEPALFRIAGPEREANNFSKGTRYASGYFGALSDAFNTEDPKLLTRLLSELFKYSAINLTPPFVEERNHKRKGTIEYRHHEGCVDMKRIRRWINIIMCIKKAAQRDDLFSPAWMESVSRGGLAAVVKDIFGNYSDLFLYPELESDCIEGVRLVQDVMHMAKIRALSLYDLEMKIRQENQAAKLQNHSE